MVAVHFALPAQRMADCRMAIDFGKGEGRSLAEGNQLVVVEMEAELVKELARMAEVAGTEELGPGLE